MKATVELITPEIAKEYLKFNTVNRPLNKNQVDFYAQQMYKGLWVLNGEGINFTVNGALANGQHRLSAVIQSGISVQMLVIRGCDNDSFVTYDTGRNRTTAEIFALQEIPYHTIMAAIIQRYICLQYGWVSISTGDGGIAGLAGNHKKLGKKELLNIYNNDPTIFQKAGTVGRECYGKVRLLSISEIGAIIVFLVKEKHHSIDFVESFFLMLFDKVHCTNTTILAFRDRIIKEKFTNSKMNAPYKQSLLIKTWNAYVMKKNISVLKYNETLEGKLEFI